MTTIGMHYDLVAGKDGLVEVEMLNLWLKSKIF